MVDVTLAVQTLDDAGVVPTPNAIATGNTYKVRNNGFVALMFRKSGAGTATITIVTPATVGGLAVADRTITVPASTGDVVAAKFPPLVYNDAGGNLNFTTDDGTGLTCRVMALKVGS